MAVKTSRLSTSIGAGATAVQVLQGSDIEFLTAASLVTFLMAQSAAGITVNVKADSDVLVPTGIPNVEVAAGRLVDPDDRITDQVLLPAGTRLKIEASNPTAGALTLSTLVMVEEIPAGMLG